MPTPSRQQSLLTDTKWQAALGRKPTIEKVLNYVKAHWIKLQKSPPSDMRFRNAEPKITQYFCKSLKANALSQGITGIFIPEHIVSEIEELKQILGSRGRTDMTYFSDRIEPALEIDFEFKKLKGRVGGKNSRQQYCQDGIIRFVKGIYARRADVGFMVGLIEHESEMVDISTAVKKALQNPDMATFLRMMKDSQGKLLASPAAKFIQSDFETHHARDHIDQCQDILLGHLFLVHKS